jgi:hypothetical protein
MLIDIYHVLKTGEPYQDAGAEAVCEKNNEETREIDD